MKTEEIIENMRICYKGKCDKCTMVMKSDCIDDLLRVAAEKLWKNEVEINNQRCEIEALKKELAELRKELAERETAPGWISVEDESLPVLSGKINMMWHMYPKDLPAYIAFYGNGANNGVTHWMTLEPPKPKEPPKKVKTYKDVFLEAFPNADMIEKGTPRVCRLYIFGSDTTLQCEGNCRCEDCWNQPYPEEEGGAE